MNNEFGTLSLTGIYINRRLMIRFKNAIIFTIRSSLCHDIFVLVLRNFMQNFVLFISSTFINVLI